MSDTAARVRFQADGSTFHADLRRGAAGLLAGSRPGAQYPASQRC